MSKPGSSNAQSCWASDDPPIVSFRLPDIFEEIPSPVGEPEEVEQWERYLEAVMPSQSEAPDLPLEEVKQQYTAMRRVEAAQGVVGSAVCCGEMDGRLTMAYLTVALEPSGHNDPLVAAEGLYRAELDKASRTDECEHFGAGETVVVAGRFTSPGRLVLAVDLPAGPAVTVISRQLVTAVPTNQYPEGLEIPAGTVQVFIPTSGAYIAILTLMTPTPDDLDEYAEVMAGIASTVEFSDQGG